MTTEPAAEPTSDWGRGAWMQTYTGRQFFPMDPHAAEVDVRDIAHALSLICRYGGHTRRFYSVAEHSWHVSYAVPPEDALRGLLHDAAEAYVGDMVRPLKHHMPDYRAAEKRVLSAIYDAVGLAGPYFPASVKEADNRILLDERDQLLSVPPTAWDQEGLQRLGVDLPCWSPDAAEMQWLARFDELAR